MREKSLSGVVSGSYLLRSPIWTTYPVQTSLLTLDVEHASSDAYVVPDQRSDLNGRAHELDHNECEMNRDNEGMLEYKDKIRKIMISKGKAGKITAGHGR